MLCDVDNLLEWINKAESGDPEAQWRVANYIVWDDADETIEPDWLERAIDYYERAAAQGYCDAMLDLGFMYRDGRGVARDIDEAFRWYKKAADMLNPKAFCHMGYALEIPVGYLDPNDENADYKTAFDYFFKGAMLGEPNSIYKVGDMYFSGKFVDADPEFAFDLYEESYNESEYLYSYSGVCLRLGECCYRGTGTDQDIDEARTYLEEAVEAFERRVKENDTLKFISGGHKRAKDLLKEIEAGKIPKQPVKRNTQEDDSDYIDFINSDMLKYPEPQQPIAELEKLKAENLPIDVSDNEPFNDLLAAAESGDKDAMYHLAFYCYNKFENESDNQNIIDFALYYYHKAIRCGYRGAMYNLGSIYYHGNEAVKVDRYKAYLLYLHSGVVLAQGELGVFYAEGEIVEQDYEKAFKCFAKCALQKINARSKYT